MPVLLPLTLFLMPAPMTEIPLWPDGVPGVSGELPVETTTDRAGGGDRWVTGVHVPTITVVQPDEERATGTAVVICPGGGYGGLALDKEGHDIAHWFAEFGVTGVVLKYRMPRVGTIVHGAEAPLSDVARALEMIHDHANEWGIDTDRVGVMGFSAGGHLAASASTLLTERRPAFSILVYPVISMVDGIAHAGSRQNLLGKEPSDELVRRFSCDERVTAETPPAFLAHTWDDHVLPENSLRYATACHGAGVPVELHLFERGGHGYGMKKPELPVGAWPDLLKSWMADRKLLER